MNEPDSPAGLLERADRQRLLEWWVVLGSNQWPLPCEGNLACFYRFR